MSPVSDNNTERLLRIRDVAERFAVTTRTVNRWATRTVHIQITSSDIEGIESNP
jgi:hypothetical protein